MNALRKILAVMFACMLASMSLFSGVGSTVAEGRTMTFHCDPQEGMSVDDVQSFDDLRNCGLVDAETPVPDGKVAIVVVVGDVPTGGQVIRELLAQHSWMNGVINGQMPTSPVPEDENYVAHGDVLGTGTCAAIFFEPGDEVVLSEGTWSLWRLHEGDADDRRIEAEFIREKAERESPPCPWVNPEDVIVPDYVTEETESTDVENVAPTPVPEDPEDLTGEQPDNQAVADESPDDTNAQQNSESVTTEPLGQNVWEGEQIQLPASVPEGSYLVLQGDADPNRGGQCSVMVFGPGESPSGHSAGTFDAFLIHGGDESSYTSLETAECPLTRTPNGA